MKSSNHIKSVLKAISVLNSFSPNSLELSAVDIANTVKIPRPTAYRMLNTLTYGGLLEQNTVTGKYRIGPLLYTLGSLYLSGTDILKGAEPVIKKLNDLTRESVNLSIFEKGNVVIIMKEESQHSYRIAMHIGSILPAYASAMGKAFLSELSDAEIDRLYPEERLQPLTKNTITSKSDLKLALQQIRNTGISFSDEEAYEWGEGIASLIRDATGKSVAAMSFSIPKVRINNRRELLAKLIKLGTSLISYRLGYQDSIYSIRDIEELRSWWEQNQGDSSN